MTTSISKDRITHRAYKEDSLADMIADLIYQRLYAKATETSPVNRRVSFSDVRYVVGTVHRLPKSMSFRLLKLLEKKGYLDIVPFSFVELKKEVIENERSN